jgi:hypothetical protein
VLSFYCPSFLYPSVVVLLERQVRVHPDTEPVCRLPVELYEPVADPNLCCQFWLEVFLVALTECELCRLRFCGVEL